MISNLIRIPSNEKAKVVEQRASLVVALKHTLQVIPGLDVALDEAEHPYFIHLKNVRNFKQHGENLIDIDVQSLFIIYFRKFGYQPWQI